MVAVEANNPTGGRKYTTANFTWGFGLHVTSQIGMKKMTLANSLRTNCYSLVFHNGDRAT